MILVKSEVMLPIDVPQLVGLDVSFMVSEIIIRNVVHKSKKSHPLAFSPLASKQKHFCL